MEKVFYDCRKTGLLWPLRVTLAAPEKKIIFVFVQKQAL